MTSSLLDTTIDIVTPEQVSFRFFVAGPGRRALSYLIDLALRALLVVVAATLIAIAGAPAEQAFDNAGTGLALLVAFCVEWLYYVGAELLWGGQSPGKRVLRLRVVHIDGTAIDWQSSLLRNLLRAADFLPVAYAIGVLVMARDASFRRLGDLVAGTMVVHERVGKLVAPIEVTRLGVPSARQPVLLSAAELEALELFARRRHVLSADRMRELALLLAPTLATRSQTTYDDPTLFLLSVYRRAKEEHA